MISPYLIIKISNLSLKLYFSFFPAVCYVEAMKMKNAMTPTAAGKVKKIHVSPGQKVEEDTILVELE